MINGKSEAQYQTIARDIASRIINNEWVENQMISGRSLLSSEYNVSPETIRRALALLSDMKVVSIKKNVGVYILSIDNAKRYLSAFDETKNQRDMQNELKQLIEKNSIINKRMHELLSMLIKSQNTISYIKSRFPDYEVKISSDSKLIGKNIGSIRFWQNTQATIIAIKRGQSVIISPGPDAELYENDTVVFVGSSSAVEKVHLYLNG
ncbi:MAG TPA: TrkA C-terminal domain-containing protein [Clostridia bacterium]|jgi:K+/H+ antiporter YhaU regulatory subunit KhtT|nr:MAG: K(+)/H(+) antiporter subunit KhtT [Firmicutes bacterium ADurb.Bin146]HOD92807.1 TrkA C-terminal domain-containing protein [Clostridia bacterium]